MAKPVKIEIADLRFALDMDFNLGGKFIEQQLDLAVSKFSRFRLLARGVPARQIEEEKARLRVEEAIATTLFEQVPIGGVENGRRILAGENLPAIAPDAQLELRNSLVAAKYVEQLIADKTPLSPDIFKHLQGLLMAGLNELRGSDREVVTGDWKQVNNRVGSREGSPVAETPAQMEALANWVNLLDRQVIHPLVAASAAQFILVFIHPFDDGNGRSSRKLSEYVHDIFGGEEFGLQGLVSLTAPLLADRRNFVRLLDEVKMEGGEWEISKLTGYMLRYLNQSLAAAMENLEKLRPLSRQASV